MTHEYMTQFKMVQVLMLLAAFLLNWIVFIGLLTPQESMDDRSLFSFQLGLLSFWRKTDVPLLENRFGGEGSEKFSKLSWCFPWDSCFLLIRKCSDCRIAMCCCMVKPATISIERRTNQIDNDRFLLLPFFCSIYLFSIHLGMSPKTSTYDL